MYQEIDVDRWRFLSAAAAGIAAARLDAVGASSAQSVGTNTFGELKQIDAAVLNIGYAELGPPHGGAVVLLHGWPYDIHSYVDVAPLLASAGYRVIVPYTTCRRKRPRPSRKRLSMWTGCDCPGSLF